VRVTWLGHATCVLDLEGVRIVTDPLVRRHAGLLRRRGERPSEAAWQRPDAVLLSHLHHDHAELRSLRMMGEAPVLTAPANARWLRRQGLRGRGLGPEEWVRLRGGVEVRLVPAVHGGRPMPHRPNAATGHLVRAGSATVWFAGDTELFPQMARLGRWAGGDVDLALVPVHGWGPRLSSGHLDAAGAARACALVGARFAVPIHWGTLHAPVGRHLPPGWMDEAGPAFAAALRREAPGCEPVVLAPGKSWELPTRGASRLAVERVYE